MNDAKLFQRGKANDLKAELSLDKKDKNHKNKKIALKKIVANMTMSNNEMIGLFPDVIACMSLHDIDIKKMCFLYLLTYSKVKPRLALQALPVLTDDMCDTSPLIRALSLRTASSIPVKEFFDSALQFTKQLLKDEDPYVRKTAAYSAAKLWHQNPEKVEKANIIERLNELIADSNPTVISAALAALRDITENSNDLQLSIDKKNAFNLAHILSECNEWSQIYVLQALMHFVPQQSTDAVLLIERILPRLQHVNSSVVLGVIRLIVYLINYIPDINQSLPGLSRRIGPSLVILLSKPPEIQYLVLRNCILLLQSRPELLDLDVQVFFCKYNDPIYVKSTKLEIVFLLANENNIRSVLREFQDCATEIDVQIVKKSVRAMGKLAIKIESAATECINAVMELVQTKISYVVQEAVIVVKNIFRKYPNRYLKVIGELCENLDSLDEPESRASMIWIIGQYADRIENSHILLDEFVNNFLEETVEVQLALLTAVVKLFIVKPTKGQSLVPKILKMATEEIDNPDVRDRGFMYWRLLSSCDSEQTGKLNKEIISGPLPIITADSDRMDDELVEELELVICSLATIYLKPIKQVFRTARVHSLAQSPALAPRRRAGCFRKNSNDDTGPKVPPKRPGYRDQRTVSSNPSLQSRSSGIEGGMNRLTVMETGSMNRQTSMETGGEINRQTAMFFNQDERSSHSLSPTNVSNEGDYLIKLDD